MDITTSAIGIELAHATLRAAALFLGADDLSPRRSVAPNKVVGNGLRELDRFLSILIDEVAVQASRDDAALDRLRSRRNTANKLRMLQAMLGRRHHPDHRRLRALGRSRDCLFYCDGRVRRADVRSGQMMTAGWPSHGAADAGDLMTTPLGGRLAVRRGDIDDVCRFYARVADELLAVAGALRADRPRHRAPVVFRRQTAHIGLANVACDGF